MSSSNGFEIIVAVGAKNIIGQKTDTGEFIMPWPICLPDLKNFRTITIGPKLNTNVVIMGHNTWLSLPKKSRPLGHRVNVVISRNADDVLALVDPEKRSSVHIEKTLRGALNWCYEQHAFEKIFVIGGAKIYQTCFEEDFIYEIHCIHKSEISPDKNDNDKYNEGWESFHFPDISEKWFSSSLIGSFSWEKGREVRFFRYHPDNYEENAYLEIMDELLNKTFANPDRTGVGTYSSFGKTLTFDLSDGRIPLLTTKRVFFRGSLEEMLFFISGSTDVSILRDKGVHIWDGNTNRKFLDEHGLNHYEEYDMGPTYSFLFRHAGAEESYEGKHKEYEGLGINQIQKVVDDIKENPYSRRHMIDLWSPAHLPKMTLPSCLFNYQFYVDVEDGSISLLANMRSADIFLGVPFNLSGASLILRMICHLTGRRPGKLMLVMKDAHLYVNHVKQAREQLQRNPRWFPILKIKRSPGEIKNMDGFTMDDFILEHYSPHKTIKAEMAV